MNPLTSETTTENPAMSAFLADRAETQYVEADGVRFAYRTLGDAQDGIPLVLCHRLRGTMDDWDPALLDALAAERPVIVFDNAGVGASTGETPASVPHMANAAAAFIRQHADQVDVLGWSMGGMVGFSLALDHPELVRRLVVAGSTPGGVEGSRPAPAKVWEVASKPVNDAEDFLYLFFPETEDGRAAGQDHLARLGRRTEEPVPPVGRAAAMAQLQAIGAFSTQTATLDRLPEMRQPVFMANGVDDIMVHAYASYAAVERLPKGQCTIYPASGHGFLFQHHARFAADVHQFLA